MNRDRERPLNDRLVALAAGLDAASWPGPAATVREAIGRLAELDRLRAENDRLAALAADRGAEARPAVALCGDLANRIVNRLRGRATTGDDLPDIADVSGILAEHARAFDPPVPAALVTTWDVDDRCMTARTIHAFAEADAARAFAAAAPEGVHRYVEGRFGWVWHGTNEPTNE